jgi:drug/metabolite transporter (DMT)-like permease
MILGGVGMSLAGILSGEVLSDFFDASLASWGWWLYLVIIGSILTYSAYLWLVANAPVGLISTYAYVNPVIAVFLGVLFLQEKLSITLLLGAVVVITGVFIVVRVESKEAQKVKVGINE